MERDLQQVSNRSHWWYLRKNIWATIIWIAISTFQEVEKFLNLRHKELTKIHIVYIFQANENERASLNWLEAAQWMTVRDRDEMIQEEVWKQTRQK